MTNMENLRRRVVSKPPLCPDYKPSKPLKMVTPSTLSKAFENSLYYMNMLSEAAGKTVTAVPLEKVVDLNVPFLPVNPADHDHDHGGDGMLEYKITEINCKIIDKKCKESGPSTKRILTLDEAIENEKSNRNIDRDEERKLRRTVSNRLSAQRSRMKKSQYIAEMKKNITELQEDVAYLNPKLDTFKQKQTMLKMQKAILEQQLKSCMNQSILCNRQIEEKRAEIRRLKELFTLKKEHMMMMMMNSSSSTTACVANSASLPHYPPENYHQRVASSSFFQCEPRPPVLELNTTDLGGIEQYLNLDALVVSASIQATDV